jgi:hypothetical protein
MGFLAACAWMIDDAADGGAGTCRLSVSVPGGACVCGGNLFVLSRVFAPGKIPNENEIKNDSIGSCGAECAGPLVLAL